MANNDFKPNYSSSDEEEEEEDASSGSEDEQTSGSESDEPPSGSQQNQSPHPTKPLISPQPPVLSSEPDQSGSETDTDSETGSQNPENKPAVSDPSIKPIRSVPIEQKEPNPDSKSGQESGTGFKSGSLTSPARNKRPAAGSPASEKEAKKASNTTTDDDTKKQLFQRLWSEDDEIVILKGMIDYRSESGENIISDMGAFYEFIKNGLHVDVSRAQLVDKIRRLRKKYVNNFSKEKDGKDRSFSKSHEQKGYELSKLIWGSNNNNNINKSQKNGTGTSTGIGVSFVKVNGMDEKDGFVMEVEKNMDISRFVRYDGRGEGPVLVEEIVKGGMELAEGAKRVELEEKWRSLKKEELEIYLRKMDLVKEQGLVVLEAVNSSRI